MKGQTQSSHMAPTLHRVGPTLLEGRDYCPPGTSSKARCDLDRSQPERALTQGRYLSLQRLQDS